MRLDKFLKVSRILKRRTVANSACDGGRVTVNEKTAKPSATLKIGDVVSVQFGTSFLTFKVMSLSPSTKKDEAQEMYQIMEGKE